MSSKLKPRPDGRPLLAPDGESVSFGTWLRRQREAREISLREIADASKISLRYLEAFEQDRFELLPARVFVQGFLREYARYVGLDGDEVVNHYLATQDALEPETPPKSEMVSRSSSRSGWLWQLLLVAVVVSTLALAAVLAFESEKKRAVTRAEPEITAPPAPNAAPEEEITTTAPAEPPPASEPAVSESTVVAETPATEVEASPLRAELSFRQGCWVEMTVDGRRSQREFSAGERLELAAERAIVLTLGNAGGVGIEVNGRPFPIDKGEGEVARDIRIDLETIRELGEGT